MQAAADSRGKVNSPRDGQIGMARASCLDRAHATSSETGLGVDDDRANSGAVATFG